MARGITPACAGNSPFAADCSAGWGDHPRLRGEQRYIPLCPRRNGGSPPLARGTVNYVLQKFCTSGITPACAGNSLTAFLMYARARDHPRLRGEQLSSVRHGAGDKGSPPLARGTGKNICQLCPHLRITPACAGNSIWYCLQRYTFKDHPRLRGEQGY